MKKRFFAALLSCIMVFSLLPMNVLAANAYKPPKEDHKTAHQISVKIYKVVLDSSKPLGYQTPVQIGTKIVTCKDRTGHSGYNHSVELKEFYPTNVGATTTDWTGWEFDSYYTKGKEQNTFYNSTSSTVNATANVTGSEPYPCSKNFYLVYKDTTPAKPSEPSDADVKTLLDGNVVKVDCINTNVSHTDQTYPLLDGSFTVGDVQGRSGSYTCTVTVNAPAYVAKYNDDTGATHTLSDTSPKTITLKHDGTKWVAQTATPIVFKVECETPEPPKAPAAPSEGDLSKLIGPITVNCTNEAAAHELKTKGYDLITGSYITSEVEGDAESGYIYTVTIKSEKYVNRFDTDTGAAHDPKDGTATIALKYEDNGWTVTSGTPVVFNVACVTPPTEPSDEEVSELLGSNAVQIICTNDESGHGDKTFGLIDGTFSIVHNGYDCEVKIDSFNEYVYSFNTELDIAQGTHASDASKADQSIINLKWVNGEWTVVDAPAKHYVLCLTPKYTVTYTDGVDGEEVFADQVYSDLLSGTATPAFEGGKPTRTGYVFADWQPAVSATVTESVTYVAQWKEDKNNNGIADDEEDKYTVTYTDGVEDEEVFADQVYGNLLSGTATPAFEGGKPTRTGYVFSGWEPTVADTVTDNATYVAQWKEDKNNNDVPDDEEDKYTVTYTDGVDGEEVFADQVYSDLLSGTATPAFNGTPTREGYVFSGWDPAVAEKVTANATYTAQWKEDKNNNGIPDDEEDKYTVTYTDGVDNEEVFADQVYSDLLSNTTTPAFNGTPKRTGYVFVGWNPAISEKVTGNATYTAQWKARTDLSYTVHYYLKDTTKKVADDKTVDGQTFNAVVTEEAIRISGYRVYGDSEKSITIGTGTNEIIFYYTRVSRPSAPSTSKPTLNTGDHFAYVMGYPDGTVRPNGSITRAEVSTILFRLLSDKTRDEYFTTESSFTDVKAGAWYNNSIATLEKAGVIVDTAKGGAFRPNEAITRAELAAMLAQFADAKPVKGVKFSDVSADHWAYDAIAIAAKMGWIEGYPDGTFRPDATITRAEMMTLVNRALERVPSDEDHLLSERVMLTFPDCTTRDWFYIAVQEATNSHAYERAATEKNGDEQWTALRDNRDWTKLEH